MGQPCFSSPAPASSPCVAAHGEMCVIFAQKMAVTSSGLSGSVMLLRGHLSLRTSRNMGGRQMFSMPHAQAVTLLNMSEHTESREIERECGKGMSGMTSVRVQAFLGGLTKRAV